MAEPRRLSHLLDRMVVDLPDGNLVVALSGGADSAALLWVCIRFGRSVRAIYIHHGWPASDMLEKAAADIADQLGVEFRSIRVQIPSGPSPEAQARQARYAALTDQARPGEWILTGHTADDQAETMIDHLLRSSGTDGLRGIPARRPPFARPFLTVSRSVTREVATLAGLAWMDDPTNLWMGPLRNRVRHELIPLLEKYNPRIRQSLATSARLVSMDVDYLEEDLPPAVERIDGGARIAASVLTTAAPSPAHRLARRLLMAAGLEHPSVDAVEGVLEVARRQSTAHEPGGGLVVRRRGPMVVASSPASSAVHSPVALEHGVVHFGRWVFESWVDDRPPAAMPLGAWWMVADADRVTDLAIHAAADHHSVLEVLGRHGVPAEERPGYPVLVSADDPLWVPGVRRLPLGWVEPGTTHYLVVSIRATA